MQGCLINHQVGHAALVGLDEVVALPDEIPLEVFSKVSLNTAMRSYVLTCSY